MDPILFFYILSVLFFAALVINEKTREKKVYLPDDLIPVNYRLGDPSGRTPRQVLPPYSNELFKKGFSPEEYKKFEERIIGLIEDGWEVSITPDGTGFHAKRKIEKGP